MADIPDVEEDELAPKPHQLKPIIKELIRTNICPDHPLFLLDRLKVLSPPNVKNKSLQAYRLWLSDGQKVIQAVLKSEAHRFIIQGDVHEKFLVVLTKYELARSRRLNGRGEVAYLKISDLYSTGERWELNKDAISPLSDHREKPSDLPSPSKPSGFDAAYKIDDPQSADQQVDQPSPRKRRIVDIDEDLISTRETQRPFKAGSSVKGLRPILRPLHITPLSEISGPSITRNKIHDVLAVVAAVSSKTIKRPILPEKRDLRIMDPSTSKKVLLSVFVNPVKFMPEVGTVALFRNVTTHEWDGGSLNAYPKDCEGREWFLPDPVRAKECDFERVARWWRERQDQGQVEQANKP
ncbi:hypothetical protein MMC09_000159 [Bachmanniomyces sp. S44760]|nr:hypothetical protein [Bachmanniomyces sp. S44760]